eukprot:Colp12_sorted_trinity150504_noHs@19133
MANAWLFSGLATAAVAYYFGGSDFLQTVKSVLSPSFLSWYGVWAYRACAFLSFMIVYEKLKFWSGTRFHKYDPDTGLSGIAGPSFVFPLLGSVVKMVMDPYRYWDDQKNVALKNGGMSWNSLVGQLMIFSCKTDISRTIFNNNTEDTLKIFLHYNAEKVLGANNIAFMVGEPHKRLRKMLVPLFTKRALGFYVQIQERLIREHLSKWQEVTTEFDAKGPVRDLNTETSQIVFVGPYLDEATRKEFTHNYQLMNDSLLTFPLNFPGTALWKGIRARKKVVATLAECAKASKERMRAGHEPECLLDFWMEKFVVDIDEAAAKGEPAPEHSSDYDIGCTVLDFLFASQDASTASLVWVLTILAERPDVFNKIREEQDRLRPNDEPVTDKLLLEMTYTRQVIKELLRYRPPAPMVAHIAQQDFPLTENYTAKKGTVLIPSIVASCHQGFPEPEKFDPDRFGPERAEDVKFGKHYLPFGTGPHYCLGREYAVNHLQAFASIVVKHFDWSRRRTPKSDDLVYLPTIYPADSFITMTKRPDVAPVC